MAKDRPLTMDLMSLQDVAKDLAHLVARFNGIDASLKDSATLLHGLLKGGILKKEEEEDFEEDYDNLAACIRALHNLATSLADNATTIRGFLTTEEEESEKISDLTRNISD